MSESGRAWAAGGASRQVAEATPGDQEGEAEAGGEGADPERSEAPHERQCDEPGAGVVTRRSVRGDRHGRRVDRRGLLERDLGRQLESLGGGGDPAVPGPLGHVAGPVGREQDLLGRRPVDRVRRDPDRRRDDAPRAGPDRPVRDPADGVAGPVGDPRRAGAVGARQEERELVAAVAEDVVGVASGAQEGVGDRPQEPVAGLVAELVVDGSGSRRGRA